MGKILYKVHHLIGSRMSLSDKLAVQTTETSARSRQCWVARLELALTRRARLWVGLLLATVLLGGLVYCLILDDTIRYPDERDYLTAAHNLVSRQIYTHVLDGKQSSAFRPPGYPFVLALGLKIGGGIVFLRWLNFFFLSGCILMVYLIMVRQTNAGAAFLGCGLIVAYPVLTYTAGTFYPQTFASFNLLTGLYLLMGSGRPGMFRIIAAAIILGYCVLTVPAFLFVLMLVGAWAGFYSTWAKWHYGLVIFLAAFSIIGAWSVRNWLVFDRFVLVSTNGGWNLLLGNSENTTPNAGTTIDISSYTAEIKGMSEVERDRYATSQALKYMYEHPVRTVKLYLAKVLNYFNYTNRLYTKQEASRLRDWLMAFSYYPLLFLMVMRLAFVVRFRPSREEVLFIMLYLGSALFYGVFFTRIRFRLPFDFIMIIIAASFLYRFASDRFIRRTH